MAHKDNIRKLVSLNEDIAKNYVPNGMKYVTHTLFSVLYTDGERYYELECKMKLASINLEEYLEHMTRKNAKHKKYL